MESEFTYSYTRKQAIEDRVLYAVNENLSKEAGIKIPVALTSTLYEKYIKSDIPGQDGSGRLWDVLFLFFLKARGCEENIIFFEVIFQMTETNQETIKLKAVIGPGDSLEGSPVLTIMLPEES